MARFDDEYYTEIKWGIVSAFQRLGFIRLPIDPVELMSANGIHPIPYLNAFDPWDLTQFMMTNDCPSGISFPLQTPDGSETWYAAYNNYESTGRTRFTAAHECCHCLFHHRETSSVAERVSDFGGGYMLVPPVLIHELGLSTVQEIAEQFAVSQDCAMRAFTAYRNWLHHRDTDKAIDDEILTLYAKGLWLEAQDTATGQETSPLETATIDLASEARTPRV